MDTAVNKNDGLVLIFEVGGGDLQVLERAAFEGVAVSDKCDRARETGSDIGEVGVDLKEKYGG